MSEMLELKGSTGLFLEEQKNKNHNNKRQHTDKIRRAMQSVLCSKPTCSTWIGVLAADRGAAFICRQA